MRFRWVSGALQMCFPKRFRFLWWHGTDEVKPHNTRKAQENSTWISVFSWTEKTGIRRFRLKKPIDIGSKKKTKSLISVFLFRLKTDIWISFFFGFGFGQISSPWLFCHLLLFPSVPIACSPHHSFRKPSFFHCFHFLRLRLWIICMGTPLQFRMYFWMSNSSS